MRNTATPHQMEPPGIGPKKTLFVLMTVVGCIAILWPKVFYPMMIGGGTPKQPAIKGHHGTVACCDVVIDRDSFMNVSTAVREQSYRTKLGLLSGELSLRQERPPHLRADGIHPAMLEKGRAIPTTHTIPLVARPSQSAPIMVEGRPGPIPGLRPPLGAGSVHKAQPKGSSMGFVMPLYTVGIIAFFVYTIMKLLFKKPVANAPYGQARVDPTFRKEVFNQEPLIKRPNDGTTKLGSNNQQMHDNRICGETHANGVVATTSLNNHQNQHQLHHYNHHHQLFHYQPHPDDINNVVDNEKSLQPYTTKVSREREQLMEIEKLRRKLEETEQAMAKLITEMGCDPYKAKIIVMNFLKQQANVDREPPEESTSKLN